MSPSGPTGGPRTGTFRVPGEGEMLRQLARTAIVRPREADENGATMHRVRRIDDDQTRPRVKSLRYRPISRVTPIRGKQ